MSATGRLTELFGRRRFSIKPGLDRINALLERHSHPERSFTALHVVGTNGKGSTASMLASLLSQAGYVTGLFTSPHLVNYHERFQLGGTAIPDRELERLTAHLLDTAAEDETFFELTTTLACCWFAEQHAQLAVLEAGMGGRSDATAAVPAILTIITPVSLDHCQWLGTDLAAIAAEKIGIATPGTPVISSRQQPEAQEVIEAHCRTNGNRLLLEGRDFQASFHDDGTLQYQGIRTNYDRLRLSLAGPHQGGNAAVALAAAEELAACGFPVSPTAVRTGLATTCWPGRMERIRLPEGHELLLDGAHNPAGAEALSVALSPLPCQRRLVLLGMMEDKDLTGTLRPLLTNATLVVTVTPQQERALDDRRLAACCEDLGIPAHAAGSVAQGLAYLRQLAQPGDQLVAAGSLFLVGELKALLADVPCDAVRG